MECLDRIAVMMAETALRPVNLLREDSPLAAVTLRTLCTGYRFNVTIRKRWPEGQKRPAVYGWNACQVGEDGTSLPDGLQLDRPSEAYADPEEAYWAALDALSALVATCKKS